MKIFGTIVLLLLLHPSCQQNERNEVKEFIYTVNGKIDIGDLGFSLTHEHVMSNFGAPPTAKPQYDSLALFMQVVPYLKSLKSKGVFSIFDCTTAYFGRDVNLLKELANATGMQIITNTGFYGAANDRYVPEMAHNVNESEIARLWIDEFENGIDGTDIKPGFIKLAFDNGVPSDIDVKLFKAGILTHQVTGLTMAVHTGNNPAAVNTQLELLKEYKVSPSAWVWVHANKVEDISLLEETARAGAWISLDGVKASNVADYVDMIDNFKENNLLSRVLVSHDGNSFPRGGSIRQYEAIPDLLIPALLEQGYSNAEINQLMVQNPREAFAVRVRNTK